MMECLHPAIGLVDHAEAYQLHTLASMLKSGSSGETLVDSRGGQLQPPIDMEIDPETGMNISANNNTSSADRTIADDDMRSLLTQFTESTKL